MSDLKKQIIISIFKIIVVVLLGLFVLVVPSFIMMSFHNLPELLESKPWLGGFINHTAMLVLSILIMLVLSKGKISTYGFKIAKNIQLKQIVLLSLGIGIIGALIQSCLPIKEPAFIENFSFIQIVIFVWIYASICEEVFTRGLVQGYLAPLARYGFSLFKFRISLPMLVGALFFASMHVMLLTTGMGSSVVFNIVLFAFILGVVAGYYREKTESLIPAILVHMLFNVGGNCTVLLIELFG
ncbi:MAG: CPBP family intramembrane glutamic endopeptidase [Candidatus Caldatribacteriota bacterium]|nr:CPBP family intramembrane glutamic endopeptidase [Candidatus Caldatribacteriota bacterium]